MIVAEVIVTGQHGVFEADALEIDQGVVHATGRWRWRTGPRYRRLRYSERVSRTWPVGRVEMRWREARAA